MSQAPPFSAWIVWSLLFPDGVDGGILKPKYPSKATDLPPFHLRSTDSDLPQHGPTRRGNTFLATHCGQRQSRSGLLPMYSEGCQSHLLLFFQFFPSLCVPNKICFSASRKLFIIFEGPDNKIWFIRCSYDPQMPNCWSLENSEDFLRFFCPPAKIIWRWSDGLKSVRQGQMDGLANSRVAGCLMCLGNTCSC